MKQRRGVAASRTRRSSCKSGRFRFRWARASQAAWPSAGRSCSSSRIAPTCSITSCARRGSARSSACLR